MRILALVPGGIGNQIYFFPTLETLKDKYPNAMIDVMVEPDSKPAYRVCKNVNNTIGFDYQDRSSLADYLNILGVIRDGEYDAVISYDIPWTLQLVLWLNGIPIRVQENSTKTWLLSNPVSPSSATYLPEKYYHSLKGFDIDAPSGKVKINVPEKDIEWAEAEQDYFFLKDGYILLHGRVNDYPQASWDKIVADIQTKQPDLSIAIVQDTEDSGWIEQITANNANLKTIIPSDVGKLAAIIAGANIIISTDPASCALALAVDTHTIALCPSSQEKQILPPDNDSYVVLESSTYDMGDIKPETVLEKLWST